MRYSRQTQGVASGLLPLIAIPLFLPLSALYAQTWAEYGDVPVSSSGDLTFYADIASYYDGAENLEEIYFLIANDQVKFLEDAHGYKGRLRLSVDLLNDDGSVAGKAENEVTVYASSSEEALDRSVVQVLQTQIHVPPGRYVAKMEIEDLNAVKKALIPYILKRHKKGRVEVLIDSPDFKAKGIALSDIEFARGLRRTSKGQFQKSGLEIIPNPPRRYGLLLPELAIYFEVYDFDQEVSDSVTATYRIVNRTGAEIYKQQKLLRVRGERTPSTALFDITSLSAGSYLLVVSLDLAGRSVSSQRKFDVAWSPLSWGRYETEMIGDVEYILTEKEMEEFESLSPGGRERYLEEFWRRLDPTPGTAENEARTEHYRRVVYADKHFGTSTKRGALSDRGRLYIKYGPPDDIQSFYSDMDFVKGRRHIEGAESPVPTDPFTRVGIKAGSGEPGGWQQAGSSADVHGDQIGGMTVHGKAYEIWTYEGAGKPIRRLSKRIAKSPVMQFILVDEKGIGDYRLVYSTEQQEY